MESAKDSPACAIQHGTLETQASVVSTLAALPASIAAAGLGSPALLVVGEVVRHAKAETLPSRQQAA